MPFHLNLDAPHPFFTQLLQFRTWGRERYDLVALRLEIGNKREIEADGLGYRDSTEESYLICHTYKLFIFSNFAAILAFNSLELTPSVLPRTMCSL